MSIGLRTAVGARPHRVRLQNPREATPDGDGSYEQGFDDLNPPQLSVEITSASAAAIEDVAAGTSTTLATATHLVKGPFHPGVTTKTILWFGAREFHVGQIVNVEERSQEMILICTEIKE